MTAEVRHLARSITDLRVIAVFLSHKHGRPVSLAEVREALR